MKQIYALIAGACLPLSAVSSPKVVYVAAGGEGDGSSWAAASGDLAAAYAAAADYAAAGKTSGEVRVKTGYYYLSASIQLRSRVVLRGGYAGVDEAEVSDPAANLTILTGSKDGSAMWLIENDASRPGGKVFTADPLACQLPNPAHTDLYWCAYGGNADTKIAFVNTTDASLEGAEIDGFTIGCFYQRVLELTAGTPSALTMRRCRIVGNTTARTNYETVRVEDTGISFEECAYIGNYRPMAITCSKPLTNAIVNCLFGENRLGCLNLTSKTNAVFDIRGCEFSRNHADAVAGGAAIRVYYPGNLVGGYLTVSNCLFEANRVRGGCRGVLDLSGWTKDPTVVTVAASRFIGNEATGMTSTRFSGAVFLDGIGKNVVIRDTYFAGNRAVHEGAEGGCVSAAGVFASNIYAVLANCTFCGNSATAAGTGCYAGTAGNVDANGRLGLVQCLFDGNTVGVADASTGAEVVAAGTSGGNSTLRLIECVLRNTAPGYVPVKVANAAVKPFLLRSAISNFDAGAVGAAAFSYCGAVSTEDPRVRARVFTGANGAIAKGVGADSPFRRGGRGFFFAPDGATAYFYDLDVLQPVYGTKKPWQNVATGAQLDETSAAERGLTAATPLAPDAFARARIPGKIAYGPLNAPPAGFGVEIR